MGKTKYYVTTSIGDAALPPSIESIYRAVLGDAIARHRRMCGFDVVYLISTNTHGRRAEDEDSGQAAGSAKGNAQVYSDIFNRLDVHTTHFLSSGSNEHARAVQALLRRTMRHSSHTIYKSRYEGRYCDFDREDVSESAQPINCPRCGRPARLISEQRYFFRLSEFRDRLLALYKYRPKFIRPPIRLEQMELLVARGLTDIAISVASTHEGIPWPDDPGQAVSDLYSDLVTYMSGIGFGENGYGSEEFQRNWPADLHVTSLSALPFHAIYWPAFLMAADVPSPGHIFAHATLKAESEGSAQELVRQAVGHDFASDAVRYYLLRSVHYVEDSRMDPRDVATCYQVDLVRGLEDLVKRVLILAKRYCQGKIPSPPARPKGNQDIEICVADLRAEVRVLLDAQNFTKGLARIWSLIALIQTRLDDALALEENRNSLDTYHLSNAVHNACEGIGWLALLLNPILPRMTVAIWKAFGQRAQLENQLIDETPWCCLMPGTQLGNLTEHSH
jgi:methionyl-tRNA synthetase